MALKFVAENLKTHSRPFDHCGRWGGEEFVYVMADLNREDLVPAAETLRVMIERSFLSKGRKTGVTISVGATLGAETDTVDKVVNRSDRLMYEGNSAGKNRVTLG